MADAQRLQQVLLNLLSNGVKYNREGGHLSVECFPAPVGRIRLAVRDTGEGIAPELLPRLFVPFDRLGAERSATAGTGLGLSLTRALVEAMAGTIEVESNPAGTTFVLQLATADSPDLTVESRVALAEDWPRAARSEAAVVLYIEDNLSNLTLVERILQTRPYVRLIPAMQGRIGLELAQQHSPALVLLDLHLPDISGDEVLRQLRLDPRTAHIPVVIASADATQRQVERLLAAGADRYLTKPLDVTLLLSVLDEFLAQPAPEPST
ncbi:MAG TPA: ATP-binding protein [Tepidiformaceae bacterium]|nr:ATP-binding protein [Tepidiformaceae bacterium]